MTLVEKSGVESYLAKREVSGRNLSAGNLGAPFANVLADGRAVESAELAGEMDRMYPNRFG